MISRSHYKPEKEIMQQALPFTIAKIILVLIVFPPWLLNSTIRELPLFYTFYAIDYCLIPTVIPLSFLATFYRRYLPTSPSVDCDNPVPAGIFYAVGTIDKLLAPMSAALYYLIYRKVLNLANMVSKNHYRPEKRVMQQALPFTIAKIVLLLMVLPPWLLNPSILDLQAAEAVDLEVERN
ncbi:unnamed protein product [Caenorhabditis auriculariae]|uniref:Uncharacterized protein n=1 Tax=Caenorhabditis auriculariae TaxID=2777116 RepID=A0A8S1HU77_9PELO|nr:unnamed protein product [Caenorhabditis auriculariae]